MSKRFLNTITLGLVAGLSAQFPANSKIVVAGEGTWAYSLPNYDLEFTPASGFTGTPTPLTATEIASLRVPSTQYIMVEPTAVGEPSRFKVAVTTDFKTDGTIGVGFLAAGLTEAQITPLVEAAIAAALQAGNYAAMEDLESVQQDFTARINQTNGNLQSLSGLVDVLRLNQHATRFIKAGTDPVESTYFLNVACTTAANAATDANFSNFNLYATENGEYSVNAATVTLVKGDIVVISPLGVELLRQDTSRITALENQISILQSLNNKGYKGSLEPVGEVQAKVDTIITNALEGVYSIAVKSNGSDGATEMVSYAGTDYTVQAGTEIQIAIDETGAVSGFYVDNDSNALALIAALQDTLGNLAGSFTDLEDMLNSLSSNLNYLRTSFVNSEARPVHFAFDLAFASSTRITLRDIFGYFHGANPPELLGYSTNRFEMLIEFIDSREVKTPIQITEVVGFMTQVDNGVAYQQVSEGDKIKTYFSRVNGNLEYHVDQVMEGKFYPNQLATQAQVAALAAIIDPNLFG